jgi:hypothetical protein
MSFNPCRNQCCGSMTFWCGSRSADLCLWLMDPDPGSRCGSGSFYFHHWPSRCQQKKIFFKKFLCIVLFEGTSTSSLLAIKIFKKVKKSQNCRNPGFSHFFCLMIEGPDLDPDPYLWLMDPKQDPWGQKTCGSSGSGSGIGSATRAGTFLDLRETVIQTGRQVVLSNRKAPGGRHPQMG